MALMCPICKSVLPDGSRVCTNCGTKFAATAPGSAAPQNPECNAWLVEPNERIRYSLKNGFLTNVISSEGFIDEDAVITDKRLYYNVTSWRSLVRSRTEMKIDLDDITATTITDSNPIILLVLSGLVLLFGIVSAMFFMPLVIVGILLSLVFAASWYSMKKTYFKVEYAGGSTFGMVKNNGVLYFSVKKYGIKAVREFQKEIHKAKYELEITKLKLNR